MTYTEKELDQFLHGISLSLLSKKSAQHWRYDEETAKEIEWLEVLERKVRADKADRKTENSSEKPNNYCDDCLYTDTCDSKEFFYACTSKATISKMEQVDKDINARSKTEPQTCSVNGRPYSECGSCEHFKCTADEPQTEMTTEQIVNELLSIKKILDAGKMPKQTHDIRTNTHECVKDTHDKTEPQTETEIVLDPSFADLSDEQFVEVMKLIEPQTERRCGNCKHLTYRWNKTWCDIKCDNPHDMVCDKWERSE